MVVFLVRDKTISVIGAGSLGEAVVNSLYMKKHRNVIATRRDSRKLEEIQEQYGIKVSSDNNYAVENSDIVVICVKPKLVDQVCEEIKFSAKDKLVISLAAKKSLRKLEEILNYSRVCRVMTGIAVDEEVAAYTFGSDKKKYDGKYVQYIFGNTAIEVDERSLADRTAIACDTGLLAKRIEYMVKSLDGLKSNEARFFYAGALEGIAKCLRKGMTGDEIYDSVAGPGSFTEGLQNFLSESGAYNLITECAKRVIKACRK